MRWGAFCYGLKELNAYLEANASHTGPLFCGDEPCMVEAAIAPALFRMIAVLVRRGHRSTDIRCIYIHDGLRITASSPYPLSARGRPAVP